MPEYRFHITVTEHGRDPANGDRVLEAFMETHPEVGPVVSQNTVSGTLSVTFSLEAEDVNAAIDLGRPVFAEGGAASGLPSTQVVGFEISLVPAEEYELVPEPDPLSV